MRILPLAREVRRISLAFVFIAIWIVTTAHADDLKPEDLYKKIVPSVMTLRVVKETGETVQGSGFMAMQDGLAITAWHVVRDSKKVTAIFSNGEEFESTGLIDKDEKRDLALIKIHVFGKNLLALTGATPDIGARAFVIGAPEGLQFSVTDGLVSQIQHVNGIDIYQYSCPTSPGNSGGPLINGAGEVMGVVSFQSNVGQNLNFAIPSSYAMNLNPALPEQAWGSIKDELAGPGFQAAGGVEDLDLSLANAWLSTSDAVTAISAELNVLGTKDGFHNGVPPEIFQLQTVLRLERISFQHLATADPEKDKLLKSFSQTLRFDDEALSYLIAAVQLAQTNDIWTPKSNDLASQVVDSLHQVPTVPLEKSDYQVIGNSAALKLLVPDSLWTQLHTPSDGTGFSLGILQYVRNPTGFAFVKKGSVADMVGLRSGDVMVAANKQVLTCPLDLKRLIKENLGGNLKMTIMRDNKLQDIELHIPAQLPASLIP